MSGPIILCLCSPSACLEANHFAKKYFPRVREEGQLHGFLSSQFYENRGIWSELGSYGSRWARVTTGRSHMAQDHFQTPPDPNMAMKDKKQKNPTSHFFSAELTLSWVVASVSPSRVLDHLLPSMESVIILASLKAESALQTLIRS